MLEKGTEITCPKCGRVLLRLTRRLKTGTVMNADAFEGVDMDSPMHGQAMLCQFDGTAFAKPKDRGYKLHTREGWR